MPTPTPEAWAQMRHDYEHTDKPVEDICAEHRISAGTLRDRVRRWRWTPRRMAIPSEGPPPSPAPLFDLAAPFLAAEPLPPSLAPLVDAVESSLPDAADSAPPRDDAGAPRENDAALIVPRLQGAVARVLPAIEAIVGKLAAGPTQVREMERAARALAALMRTLRELNTLLAQYPAPAADERTDEEMRIELARKIQALIDARKSGETDAAQPEEA